MCRNLIFKILFLLLFLKCTGQENVTKKLGIGFLYANTENPIPIYKNPKNSTPIDIIKFEKDKSGIMKFITSFNLKPYIIYGGVSYEDDKKNVYNHFPVLAFRVIDTSKQYFKVVLNEQTFEEAFVKREKENVYYSKQKDFVDYFDVNYNSKWFLFETWERILLNATNISFINLLIYDKPNGKLIYKQVNYTDYFPFITNECKGDWIKVIKKPGSEFFFEKDTNYDGWVKWKENEVLNVNFGSISSVSGEIKK